MPGVTRKQLNALAIGVANSGAFDCHPALLTEALQCLPRLLAAKCGACSASRSPVARTTRPRKLKGKGGGRLAWVTRVRRAKLARSRLRASVSPVWVLISHYEGGVRTNHPAAASSQVPTQPAPRNASTPGTRRMLR